MWTDASVACAAVCTCVDGCSVASAFLKADALLRERMAQTAPARVASSLAPGTKIYIKGKGHAEYKGGGGGATVEFANGIAKPVQLEKTEWTRVREPPKPGLHVPMYQTSAPAAGVGLGNALGWAGLDSLDEFEAKHSPRPGGATEAHDGYLGTDRGLPLCNPNPLIRGPFDNGPAPARRMSREQPSQHNPLVRAHAHTQLHTPQGARQIESLLRCVFLSQRCW